MFGQNEIVKQKTIDTGLIKNWIECLLYICKGDVFKVKEKLIYNVQDKFEWSEDTSNFINQELGKIYLGEYYG